MLRKKYILLDIATQRSRSVSRCAVGFYSAYFLVHKKTGGFRPILDLCILNQCIARKTFHMLTIRRLLELVQPGDWFTTIDVKDAYFHVKVALKHRKFLPFAF